MPRPVITLCQTGNETNYMDAGRYLQRLGLEKPAAYLVETFSAPQTISAC